MKTKLLFICSFLSIAFMNAQNLIAVQNGNAPNFYEDVNEAFDNAIEGDTLYFPGGIFNLNRTINKTLHIVGTGHNPNITTATGATIFASEINGTPQLIYASGGGGTVTGIAFTDHTNCSGGVSCWNIRIDSDIDGLLVDRVSIPKGFYCYLGIVKNLAIIKSVISKFDIREIANNGVLPTGLISNNIIYSPSSYATNLSVENNCFLSASGNGNPSNPPLNANSSSVINNIFNRYSSTGIFDVAQNSSFRNNAGFGGSGVSGTNYLSNNIAHSVWFDSIFVSSAAFPSIGSFYTTDFHLINTSVFINAANDGGQLGVYGGRFPWKDDSTPFNPHIVSKNISGSTDENGNLPVTIEVQAQEN